MRDYFELCDASFLGVGGNKARRKVILDEVEGCLTQSEEMGEQIYFAQVKECVMEQDGLEESMSLLVERALKRIFKSFGIIKKDLIMVVGIGNEGLIADSLGARVVEKIKVTAHLGRERGYGRVCAYAPSVSGVTGIISFDVVKALVDKLSPKVIICVDTLACRNMERLGKGVQIKDGGLVPGAGVGNTQNPLDYNTLGVPVISIGVPLVIYARNLLLNYLKTSKNNVEFSTIEKVTRNFIVTVKEIDFYIDFFSESISNAINRAVHGKI